MFSFVQMADVQFGLFADVSGADQARINRAKRNRLIIKPTPKIHGFSDETSLYTKAINAVNQLCPDFVVMCGDMINDFDDQTQLDELFRITDNLSEDIPMKWVAGNHDVGNELTRRSLAIYRGRFGKDNYFFDHKGSRFIILNSNTSFYPSKISGEWERQMSFLSSALEQAREIGSMHIIIFTHHPLFLRNPDEEDSPLVIPKEKRLVILDLLGSYNTTAVFAGHWHRNNYAYDRNMMMVTSASVGYPFGYDPSGFRIVKVFQDSIEHQYIGLDELEGFDISTC